MNETEVGGGYLAANEPVGTMRRRWLISDFEFYRMIVCPLLSFFLYLPVSFSCFRFSSFQLANKSFQASPGHLETQLARFLEFCPWSLPMQSFQSFYVIYIDLWNTSSIPPSVLVLSSYRRSSDSRNTIVHAFCLVNRLVKSIHRTILVITSSPVGLPWTILSHLIGLENERSFNGAA